MVHRALIVAAVSTTAQAADDKGSIPRQLDDCRAACASHKWQVAAEVVIPGHSRNYDDLAELVADCPEYGQIIKHISGGAITLVVAWAYDRLYRTDALRAQVSAYCRRHRVQVYALDLPYEPSDDGKTSSGARAMEMLKGFVSEDENEKRILRSKAGKEAVIRQGYTLYANYVPFGYRKVIGSNILQVIPSEARLVRWMYNRRAIDRWTIGRIARELNTRGIASPRAVATGWSWATTNIILNNSVYKGTAHYGGISTANARHEAIISPDLWDQAHQVAPSAEHHSSQGPYLLTGLARCGYCGYAMVYTKKAGVGLSCSHYRHTGAKECQCNYHTAKVVHPLVLDRVAEALNDPAAFIAFRASQHAEDAALDKDLAERELRDLAAEAVRWKAAYGAGVINLEELSAYLNRIEAKTTQAKQVLAVYDSFKRRTAESSQRILQYASLANTYYNLEPAMQREVLLALVERITLRRGSAPDIVWI